MTDDVPKWMEIHLEKMFAQLEKWKKDGEAALRTEEEG